MRFRQFLLLTLILFCGLGTTSVFAQSTVEGLDENAPVDLTADTLENDENNQIVTAIGNVELVQAGRILKADRVFYNLGTDTVYAQGNVVLNEPTGETYFADEVELTDEMKDGFATGIRGLLTDGARFSARQGQRVGGTKLIMDDAVYTACEPCKEKPDKPPVWQLAASEVTHDEEDQRIIYRDARLEMFGVPVLYTPYFSHPDGSVNQKSGFLTPSFGFDSELGANYTQEYYWAIDESKDATIGAMVATDVNPLVLGEYRQRFENASLSIGGGITYSDRFDTSSGITESVNEEVRGHVDVEALWNINNKWRAGIDSEWASDDQYMRQYNISSEDILENRIYAERFSGRNYANIQTIAFQDIRTSDRQDDQPGILPEIQASFIGEPSETLGGRWHADLSALSLVREGNDQDLGRASGELGWERRLISDTGLVTKLHASGRADVYYVSDRDIADLDAARSNESKALRGFAQGHIETSYPLVSRFENVQAIIEPVAAITV
ncbi:MAG: LPS assembly protein LptD, partial [Pseudomonadota bacterium]